MHHKKQVFLSNKLSPNSQTIISYRTVVNKDEAEKMNSIFSFFILFLTFLNFTHGKAVLDGTETKVVTASNLKDQV